MSEEMQQSKTDKDDWLTPKWIYEPIDQHDGIYLDPCAGEDTYIGEANPRPRSGWDGLEYEWEGVCFVNPPFSEKVAWAEKCVEEAQRSRVERVYLLSPDCASHKSFWHAWIEPHAQFTCFFEGRVKYVDPATGEEAGNPSFGSALHVFGDSPPTQVLRWMDDVGDLVTRGLFF